MTLHRAVSLPYWAGPWKEEDSALALMIALLMVMRHILGQHMAEGCDRAIPNATVK